MNAAHICKGMKLFTGAWLTYQATKDNIHLTTTTTTNILTLPPLATISYQELLG